MTCDGDIHSICNGIAAQAGGACECGDDADTNADAVVGDGAACVAGSVTPRCVPAASNLAAEATCQVNKLINMILVLKKYYLV